MQCSGTIPTAVSNTISIATRASAKRCTDFSSPASQLKTRIRLASCFYTSSTVPLMDESLSNRRIHNSNGGTRANFFGSVAAFPWRHSPIPLPRFCLPDSIGIYEPFGPHGLCGFRTDPLTRFFLKVLAARSMNVSWLEILLAPKTWETPLANNYAAAFRTCLGCLLSYTFRVPLQSIVLEDGTKLASDPLVSFDSDTFHNNRSDMHKHDDDNELDVIDDSTLLQMVDSKLLDLYRLQKSKSSQPALSVFLQTQVLSATLENIHVIPFLTREMVQHNPDLRGSLQEIFAKSYKIYQIERKPLRDAGNMFSEEFHPLWRKIGRPSFDPHADGVALTIVAQVTILCKEKFRAIDVLTGECLQGDPNATEHIVPHLVRFERVMKYNEQKRLDFIGQWKIIDWDDLLDGNIWY